MFTKLIADRSAEEPKSDFISLMAHSPHMKDFTPAIEKMTAMLLERETIGAPEVESCFPEAEQIRARAQWTSGITSSITGIKIDPNKGPDISPDDTQNPPSGAQVIPA